MYTVLQYSPTEIITADGATKTVTTPSVKRYINKFGSDGKVVSDFAYTYDAWGNITSIADLSAASDLEVEDGTVVIDKEDCEETTDEFPGVTTLPVEGEEEYGGTGRHYSYNDLGEVEKAYETYTGGTTVIYTYQYDEGGNIVTETIDDTVHTYTYDSVWKDKLIAYDGKTITYDVFGCPTDYMGAAMTWDIYGGLTSVDNGTDTITYTYMGDGQRRSKTVNGVTTTYHYNNGMLLSETTGDETLRYYYDSTGKVASLVYKKGDEEERSYFYTRNVQGDITAVYRSKDSKLMGTYEYDLWGRLISITPTDKDTDGITEKNPYRYRGYYYDNETGFYYLKARYYDPEIRRFISADSLCVLMVATIDVSCKNLFAYSENNPVTGKDSSGMVVETVFDVITLAGSIAEVCANPGSVGAWVNAGADLVDAVVPFATGIGEAVRGARAAAKATEAVGDINDAAKAAKRTGEAAKKVTKGDIPSGYSIDAAGKVHRPNGQFASNAELGLPSTTKVSTGSHGNSLLDPRTNYGYALVDKNSNDILKYGETLHPTTRYSQSYLDANNADMIILEQGNKLDIHLWQHDKIVEYQLEYGSFPPLNKSEW